LNDFLYVSEIQEEAPMDNKKNWKRGKEKHISYKTFKEDKSSERDP
jgi:hypothetical protein